MKTPAIIFTDDAAGGACRHQQRRLDYISAGVPHLPYNPSETETCTAVIARTDPLREEVE